MTSPRRPRASQKQLFLDGWADLSPEPSPTAPDRDVSPSPSAKNPIKVSDLTRQLKASLEGAFPAVLVWGEVSNLSRPRSGHVYFTLKDDEAQISCVLWRNVAERLPFRMDDGQELVVAGPIKLYEPRGSYQIQVQWLEPRGRGALQLAYEQLKQKLAAEGLFDDERKRALPLVPRTIALVTSPRGAAVHDMLRTITERFPPVHVRIYPVRVQGEGAAEEIASAIEDLNRWQAGDVIVVGRGGGSIEDLWAFNEERVARAIHASRIPVVSAVGHEVDLTIADLVADRRARTPTEAGVLVVPELQELRRSLQEGREGLDQALDLRMERWRQRLDLLARSYTLGAPLQRLDTERQRLDDLAQRIDRAVESQHDRRRTGLDGLAQTLYGLSPLGVLGRGYSLTTRARDGAVVRSAGDVSPGDTVLTRLHDGTLRSTVETDRTDTM